MITDANAPAAIRRRSPPDDLSALSATDALHRLQAGSLTAVDYAEALLTRCSEWQHLNAFASLDRTSLLEAAAVSDRKRRAGHSCGPLHGLPIVIKDNVDVAGYATSAGTPALRHFRPRHTAPAAARLFEAGALLLGKNTLHELAHGISCRNGAFGAVHNPYHPAHSPGGSSGGTAAAISARLAPAGLGTDTGGSVRIPAALSGIVGFRPSTGRYPAGGIVPISHTRDTPGPMARSVADVALLDGILAGAPGTLGPIQIEGVRLGVPRAYFYTALDMDVARLTEAALERLRSAGVVLVEVEIASVDALAASVAGTLSDYEFPRDLAAYLAAGGSGITLADVIAGLGSEDVRASFANDVTGPRAPTLERYREALEVGRPALRAAYRDCFAAHRLDALAFPTTTRAAPPIESTAAAPAEDEFLTYLRNARPATVAALPSLSLPSGLTPAGLPVGLELDGPEGSDRRLLALGAAISAVLPSLPAPRPAPACR